MSDNTEVVDEPEPETYELTAGQIEDMGARFAIMGALGQQFGGDRDLYDTFGWIKDPDIDDFYANYLRNPYARAVVDAPVATSWRGAPEIFDDAETDEQTEFESELETLVDEHRLWHYGERSDKLSGIGEYGILIIGFDDGASNFAEPVQQSNIDVGGLNWLRPLSQKSVKKIRFGEMGSGRWGRPIAYKIDLTDENDEEAVWVDDKERWIHWSRVAHMAEELLDDEVRGTPRQEPVLNPLTDIEKTLGSAAELAYRGADYGLHANVDPQYKLEDGGENLDAELFKFVHDLQPVIRTEGVDIEKLEGADIDPSPIINAEIEAISAQTGLPQSVLKGNETGERATTQDLKEWYGKISERREQFVTPTIVRQLIDRLVKFGVLPAPQGGQRAYTVEWPPLEEDSAQEIADVQVSRAEVIDYIANYVPSMDSGDIVEFVEEGDFPEIESEEVVTDVDESDPQVQQFMQQAFGPQEPQQNGEGQQPVEADD
ncbi:anti-CBASS protein Acb1 family protein [Halocatena marina]|uniref:anti-CBASS protein Acb1 family protein n=1 Tax=Halocatena marina TaxID=2934937 RepID=UPI00200ED64F|nr:anti-CBASS Acb1 family protein [Halocatena marina]